MREQLTAYMSHLKRLLNSAADLIVLNLLTIVCCLPVVTIGAAWTACYAGILRIVRGQETGIPARAYFVDFRKAFRTATPAWLLALICIFIIAGDYYFAVYVNNPPNRFFLVFSIAMATVLLFGLTWLFPLMARFENTMRGHIKNAFLMAAGTFPKTLLAVAAQLFFLVLPLFVPLMLVYLGWLWVMLGLSLPMYITARLFQTELDCVPKPEDAEQPTQDGSEGTSQD